MGRRKKVSITDDNWHEIVDIFYKNIKIQYLDPVERILDLPGAELAILAIDCMLIELLQQFREGRTRKYYKNISHCYLKFLTGTSFHKYFTEHSAGLFYSRVRNDLIHKGRVGKAKKMLAGMDMRVTCFHGELVRVVDDYVEELKTGNNKKLKQNFIKKMSDMGWLEDMEKKQIGVAC